jgi:hypothetical protein
MRAQPIIVAAAVFAVAVRGAAAQDPLTNAKRVAQNAAAAENAHIAAEQASRDRGVAIGASAPRAQGQGHSKANPQSPVPNPHSLKLDLPSADTGSPPPTIVREGFDYPRDGRRDPFVSLLTTNELRPAMSDLRLTGILYDQSGMHSVATLRDLGTNAQYRVTIGSVLGRMHVSTIRVKTIVFTIEEFGTTRQDSLVLGDSTKARVR